MVAESTLPTLYVEGNDDRTVIGALLRRHGIDTAGGTKTLYIKSLGDVDSVLDTLPVAISASTGNPVGFVIDIDIQLVNRWRSICDKLKQIGVSAPPECPAEGFFGKLSDYPHQFGIWLMPDCATDDSKMEHLIQSLTPAGDPRWQFAVQCVAEVERLVDEANDIIVERIKQWRRFREVDRIKAEVHTWLAWQHKPGLPFGAAINDHILRHDSSYAVSFLKWLGALYGLDTLSRL